RRTRGILGGRRWQKSVGGLRAEIHGGSYLCPARQKLHLLRADVGHHRRIQSGAQRHLQRAAEHSARRHLARELLDRAQRVLRAITLTRALRPSDGAAVRAGRIPFSEVIRPTRPCPEQARDILSGSSCASCGLTKLATGMISALQPSWLAARKAQASDIPCGLFLLRRPDVWRSGRWARTASTSISTPAACGYVNPNGTDDRRRIGSLYRRVNVVRKPGGHGVAV